MSTMSPGSRSSTRPAHEPSGAFLEGPETPTNKGRASGRPTGTKFDAELDCAELDDRMRPGRTWACRARELSRSSIMLMSRRMCYVNRILIMAVHLIDDAPVALMGRIASCEYEADGMYRIDIDLLPLPPSGPHRDWVAARGKR